MEIYNQHKIIESEELEAFFNKLLDDARRELMIKKDSYYRYYICFSLLAGSGLRASELLSLKFGNLYKYTLKKIDLVMMSVLGKGNKERDVILPPNLSKLIFDYETYCIKNYFKTSAEAKNKFLIFKTKENIYNGGYTYKWMFKTLKELQDKYNLREFSPHKFRHTFSTMTAPIDLVNTSKQLGHKSPDTTLIYTHLSNPDKLLKALEEIDNMFKFKPQ